MGGIVCAIRGGLNSRSTIDRAIALAKEGGLRLHFLYVINLDFLSDTSSNCVGAVSEKIREMGRSVLLSVKAVATEQGITAQGVVRDGFVGDEIVSFCRDLRADYVVLGHAPSRRERGIFHQNTLKQLSERIEKQTGATVVLSNGKDGRGCSSIEIS